MQPNTGVSTTPTAASVQKLKQFSFITNAEVVQLVEELPNYLAIADGAAIKTEEGKVQWWATHATALPNWSAAVKKILLLQPSSKTLYPILRIFRKKVPFNLFSLYSC